MTATSTLDALARVDALRAELDAMRPLDLDRLGAAMQRLRIEWTYHSNAIEGNSLDYGETRALLMHGVTAAGKPLKDHLDITGHREALDYLEQIVQDTEPLTLAGIREMHKLLLGEPYESWAETPDGQRVRRKITPGEFKTQPNHVLTVTGETHYYAPPERVPAQMADLVDLLRSAPDVHPLVFASDIHHRLAAIHPFDDGNGRMARLLMNLVLMRAGYPPAVLRQQNRPAYYGALAAADGGDLAPLVRFIADELAATMELYLRALRGEPDPDVFSRRLGLLTREMKTRGDSGVRSSEALRKIAESFVAPFLERLNKGVRDLSPFYIKTDLIQLYTDSNGMKHFVNDRLFLDLPNSEWIEFRWQVQLQGHLADPSKSIIGASDGRAGASHVAISLTNPGDVARITYNIESSVDATEFAERMLIYLLDQTEQIARNVEN